MCDDLIAGFFRKLSVVCTYSVHVYIRDVYHRLIVAGYNFVRACVGHTHTHTHTYTHVTQRTHTDIIMLKSYMQSVLSLDYTIWLSFWFM